MAKPQLTAMADLKEKFAKFGPLSDTIEEVRRWTDEINEFNKTSAGNDDIGKEYHKNVDGPTADLDDLFKKVRDKVEGAGTKGQRTSEMLKNADEEARNLN
ncbi:hypothetical protein ACFVTF_19360 [Kitasatospora sp. NPDC057940]|uniref:hypothetical protein n=1 Tax=Kitasatospora sp. NPDC057940 TaxID=3346285 RepID=UPI0036DC298A